MSRIPKFCSTHCCSIHDNQCTGITTHLPHVSHNNIGNVLNKNNSAIYHQNKCIYETRNYLYDLYKLELNPYNGYSYFYTYKSGESKASPFYNKWISLYINICNKASVLNTPWNEPPNTSSLEKFITKSTVACAEYNESALCTELGDTQYHSSDIQKTTETELTINLGKTNCLYYKNPYDVESKDIYVKLVIICDVNTYETQIISVDGPIFTLDQLDEYYPCSNDVTIKMKTNIGACPRSKIYANNSHINCPKTFNQTTKIINCTLYTMSNDTLSIGTMADIDDNYLSLYAVFATKTQNISLDFNVKSNATGIFNITLNMTAITITKLNNITQESWRNISIYAVSTYPIGPNTTTRHVYMLFDVKHSSSTSTSSVGRVFGWIMLFLAIFIIVYTGYRLQNKEARKFFCVYCMKCDCMKYGCGRCMIGVYILWCDCSKRKRLSIDTVMRDKNDVRNPLKLQDINEREQNNKSIQYDGKRSPMVSFLGFMKDIRSKNSGDDDSVVSGGSKYESMSGFLFQQQSSYAGHFGLKNNKSRSKHDTNSVSSTEENYVL